MEPEGSTLPCSSVVLCSVTLKPRGSVLGLPASLQHSPHPLPLSQDRNRAGAEGSLIPIKSPGWGELAKQHGKMSHRLKEPRLIELFPSFHPAPGKMCSPLWERLGLGWGGLGLEVSRGLPTTAQLPAPRPQDGSHSPHAFPPPSSNDPAA